jgi:hypothetical protein
MGTAGAQPIGDDGGQQTTLEEGGERMKLKEITFPTKKTNWPPPPPPKHAQVGPIISTKVAKNQNRIGLPLPVGEQSEATISCLS